MVETKNHLVIDDIDKKILKIFQSNGKASLNEMSEQTGLSTTSIRARLKKLTKAKVIKKFMAIIDCHQLGYKEMAIVSLRVKANQPLEEIKKKIDEMNKIKYGYIVTGEYPIILMFKCLDHQEMIELIEELRNLSGVEEVKTQIVLDRIKEDHTIIIPD